MSACKCAESKRPFMSALPEGSNQRPRQWFVLRRNETRSAFNGYRSEWSAYSDVYCRVCSEHWRTKAAYVSELAQCEYFPERVAPRVQPAED